MAISVTIEDAHNANKAFQQFKLKLFREKLTIAELIERRVQYEVEDNSPHRQPLVPTHKMEAALNDGAHSDETRQDLSVTRALNAFDAQHFLLFVDDKQQDDLEAQVVLTPASVVLFVRLIALQGG